MEQAQKVMDLIEDMDLQFLQEHANDVESNFQDTYDEARMDMGRAETWEVRGVVTSLVMDKTGEIGIAEKIADAVEALNDELAEENF